MCVCVCARARTRESNYISIMCEHNTANSGLLQLQVNMQIKFFPRKLERVMEDYGVAESWTKKCIVSIDWVHKFYGYTDKGELLIKNDIGVVSIYPESLNQNILAIKDADWLAYIANSVESLVLLGDSK